MRRWSLNRAFGDDSVAAMNSVIVYPSPVSVRQRPLSNLSASDDAGSDSGKSETTHPLVHASRRTRPAVATDVIRVGMFAPPGTQRGHEISRPSVIGDTQIGDRRCHMLAISPFPDAFPQTPESPCESEPTS